MGGRQRCDRHSPVEAGRVLRWYSNFPSKFSSADSRCDGLPHWPSGCPDLTATK